MSYNVPYPMIELLYDGSDLLHSAVHLHHTDVFDPSLFAGRRV